MTTKMNKWKVHIFVTINFFIKKHQDIYCSNIIHMATLEHVISLSGKSHILEDDLTVSG